MNTAYRKPLPGTRLDYFDTRAAVDAIKPGAYDTLPYTSRVLAENLVRRCDPELLTASLTQIIERKRDLDFPWFPARVVCHDILGQTALVDLAGLRDAIADMGGELGKILLESGHQLKRGSIICRLVRPGRSGIEHLGGNARHIRWDHETEERIATEFRFR